MGLNEVIILMLLILIVSIVLTLKNLLQSQFINGAIKLYYLLAILFLPFIGILIYYTSAYKYKVQ
jgi:hypothetical protein